MQGELYKTTSLLALRNGLDRHLNDMRRSHDTGCTPADLTHDVEFVNAMSAMKKHLKENDKGAIEHSPAIEVGDLKTLNAYFKENIQENPKVLQFQNFVNIMTYFGRRGRENLRDLKIMDFAVTSDSSGRMYLYQKTDESTKNHQSDFEKKDARMYQNQGIY